MKLFLKFIFFIKAYIYSIALYFAKRKAKQLHKKNGAKYLILPGRRFPVVIAKQTIKNIRKNKLEKPESRKTKRKPGATKIYKKNRLNTTASGFEKKALFKTF